MKIEKDAENILNKFSKTLENIPDLEETWYITDNLNHYQNNLIFHQ